MPTFNYKCVLRIIYYPDNILSFCLHFSLTAFSINNLQLLSLAAVLRSPLTLSRSLLTQSSHHILGLSCLLFPSIFWASDVFATFLSPIISTQLAHFNLLLTNFFLKVSFTPTSTLISSILLLSTLFSPTILRIQLFCKKFTYFGEQLLKCMTFQPPGFRCWSHTVSYVMSYVSKLMLKVS